MTAAIIAFPVPAKAGHRRAGARSEALPPLTMPESSLSLWGQGKACWALMRAVDDHMRAAYEQMREIRVRARAIDLNIAPPPWPVGPTVGDHTVEAIKAMSEAFKAFKTLMYSTQDRLARDS